MKFLKNKIIVDKVKNELDKFVFSFIKILKKHIDYVIVSGYVSILLGRSRATEDIDIFIKKLTKEKFHNMYLDLIKNNYWCLNSSDENEVYSYLRDGLSVRFARKDETIPNFEIKFPKNKLDEDAFNDILIVETPLGKVRISSLERQIAYKKFYLKSEKDIEDAEHIINLFKGKINMNKVYKYKNLLRKR